jgi:GNAT superfamily N-acetyltransferase
VAIQLLKEGLETMGGNGNSVPEIIEFQKEDAEKLAKLLNSFDKEGLWPGGFTGGVPFTAERVLDSFPVGVKNICVLISVHEGKFTGICSLHPHYEDVEAGYIGLFGVHPDYLGKKHGKTLILRSLEIAAEKNLKRVDLDTWAGNLKAVPLYKKAGLFWIPETSVEMQDYISGILNFPLSKEFFEKHDWYSSQIRKLELVPDEFRLDEMEVFPYEFAGDGDHLKVWVDRYGRGILGIERTLNGEHVKIQARLGDHKVIAGLEQELTIEITNGTKSRMQGSVFLSGFDGLNFTAYPQQSFNVQEAASIKLHARFKVNPETEVPDIHRKQKTIKANLIINGELVPLEIGMRILPLLELKTYPESVAVTPGMTGTVQFSIFNNSKKVFTGNVFILDEDSKLSLRKTIMPMKIAPKSHSGLSLTIEVSEDEQTGAVPLRFFSKGKAGEAKVETRTELVYVKCIRPGGIVAFVEKTKRGKAVFVENEDILACVYLRRGSFDVTYKDTSTGREKLLRNRGFGVGPPFGFVRPVDFDYEINETREGLELDLSAMHPDKAGVKMIRQLTFYGGTSLIREKIRIVNMNPDVTYKVNVRISRPWWMWNLHYRMIVPLTEIVEQEMVGFPVSESDLPTDPKEYKESWICFQNQPQDFYFGQMWSNEKLLKIKVGEQAYVAPEYELGEIEPGQSACTSEFYYLLGRGDWHSVRRKWRRLIQKKLDLQEKTAETELLFDIKLAENVLYDSSELKTQLKVVNLRNKGATGKITLDPPEGWKISPREIEVKEVKAKNPFTANVSIVPPQKVKLGTYSGTIRFSADNQETQFPITLCLLSQTRKTPPTVVQIEEEKKTVFKVSNGLLNFKCSAEYAGCLHFLGKDRTNQLATAFPEICTKVFLENYSGGIRQLYLDENFDFQKSKSHNELYKAELIEEEGWKGVNFSFESKEQEELKGTLGSVSYLTLPFGNIVKIKRKYKNPSQATFNFLSCLWLSPNVGGNFEKNEAVFPRADRIFRFKRAEGFAIAGVEPKKGWILVRNEEEELGLAMIAGNPHKSIVLSLDIGKTMLELFVMSRVQLQPGESCELEDYLLLTSQDHKSIDKLAAILHNQVEKNAPR